MCSVEQSTATEPSTHDYMRFGGICLRGFLFSTALYTIHNALTPYYDQYGQHNSREAFIATSMILIGCIGGEFADYFYDYNTQLESQDIDKIPSELTTLSVYDWENEELVGESN